MFGVQTFKGRNTNGRHLKKFRSDAKRAVGLPIFFAIPILIRVRVLPEYWLFAVFLFASPRATVSRCLPVAATLISKRLQAANSLYHQIKSKKGVVIKSIKASNKRKFNRGI